VRNRTGIRCFRSDASAMSDSGDVCSIFQRTTASLISTYRLQK